jgi:hypothetical protein
MATTGIGIASVTHQIIISAATASTVRASLSTLNGLTRSINTNKKTPLRSAIQSRRLLEEACIKQGIFIKFDQIKVTNKLKNQITRKQIQLAQRDSNSHRVVLQSSPFHQQTPSMEMDNYPGHPLYGHVSFWHLFFLDLF